MAMTAKERQQALILAIVLALAGGAAFWFYWRQPRVAQAAQLRSQIDSIRAQVDSARRDLASGTVESLRQRVRDYEASLGLMRLLVPTDDEVTTLVDDISARATRRGVKIGEWNPLAVEASETYRILRYRYTVFGHYDQIGEFLADIASLPRIMVPYDVSLSRATEPDQRSYGDTTGALIQAQFQLRTFVKPQAAVEGGGTTGGGR